MVEQHSAMRFAWFLSKAGPEHTSVMSPSHRSLFVAYNLVWWVPVVLGFVGALSYRISFVAFLVITIFRALANVYRVNVLSLEAAQRFPLRSP